MAKAKQDALDHQAQKISIANIQRSPQIPVKAMQLAKEVYKPQPQKQYLPEKN